MEPQLEIMERRLAKVEDAVLRLEQAVAGIRSQLEHMCTKADLHESMNAQTRWMIGIAVLLGASAITVMSFVLNNGVPKQPSPQPLVIYIPTAPAAAAVPSK
jgi:hypothetical protein